MKIVTFLLGPVVLVLSGCIQSHRQPVVVYTPPAPVPAPTSQRPVDRVYTEPSTPVVVTPPMEQPTAIAGPDIAIAESVTQVLKGDTNLAEASKNLRTTVERGVVTLRGTVPTDRDRDEIVQRVSRLPGVVRVRDHLGVELR